MSAELFFIVGMSVLVGIYGIFWGESRPRRAMVRIEKMYRKIR